jgi:RimJ/RimL family protein N-acetyltransferase
MSDASHEGGIIRKVWSRENDKLRDHLLRLDTDSRRARFAHAVNDDFLIDYAATFSDQSGLVYGFVVGEELRAAAELRKLHETWDGEAEAAFSVEPGYQNRGLGTELMGRVIRAARNRGVRHIYITCLADNTKMQRLAKKHSADLRFVQGEVLGEIRSVAPSPLSLWQEAVEDQRSYLYAVLDLQGRLLRPAA